MRYTDRHALLQLNQFLLQAICEAVQNVKGEFKPFSLTGSLPIVADLKDQGFDVQVTGESSRLLLALAALFDLCSFPALALVTGFGRMEVSCARINGRRPC
jgi:hypothetical protein